MDRALIPLESYLSFFSKFEDFLNLNNEMHVASKIVPVRKDADSTEIELPVQVDLIFILLIYLYSSLCFVK